MSLRTEAAWRSSRARLLAKELERNRTTECIKDQLEKDHKGSVSGRKAPEKCEKWAEDLLREHDFLPPKRSQSLRINEELTRESTRKSKPSRESSKLSQESGKPSQEASLAVKTDPSTKPDQENSVALKYGRGFSTPPPAILTELIPSEPASPISASSPRINIFEPSEEETRGISVIAGQLRSRSHSPGSPRRIAGYSKSPEGTAAKKRQWRPDAEKLAKKPTQHQLDTMDKNAQVQRWRQLKHQSILQNHCTFLLRFKSNNFELIIDIKNRFRVVNVFVCEIRWRPCSWTK
jgi:hypothetical protein